MTPRLAWGQPNPTTRLRNAPAIDRVMYRTAVAPNGCWIWQGCRDAKGYGKCFDGEKRTAPHLVAYIAARGPVPAGLEVDHLCFERACVNPEHLEAITHAENVRRGRRNQNDGKQSCAYGHAFTEDNTAVAADGRRSCRACSRRRTADHRASRRSA